MLAAAADSLTPKGAARQMGKLAGGLVLLLTLLRPICALDERAVEEAFSPFFGKIEEYEEQVPAVSGFSWMKGVIEEECGAYIQDKARQAGLDCQVAVTCVEGEGYPYPQSVAVSGTLNDAQRAWLSEEIESGLGVPAGEQTYQEESGEEG